MSLSKSRRIKKNHMESKQFLILKAPPSDGNGEWKDSTHKLWRYVPEHYLFFHVSFILCFSWNNSRKLLSCKRRKAIWNGSVEIIIFCLKFEDEVKFVRMQSMFSFDIYMKVFEKQKGAAFTFVNKLWEYLIFIIFS